MSRDHRLRKALTLLACVLIVSAAPPTKSVDHRDRAGVQEDVSSDVKRIAAIAKDCAERLRSIAQIIDTRAEGLLLEGSTREKAQLALLYQEVCIKQDLLRNEEVAFQMSKRKLVILWSDEYTGKTLGEADVRNRYHESGILGSNSNSENKTTSGSARGVDERGHVSRLKY